ncbi:MAG: energy-coupling factor transporter ATPase [Firmicutes bacterium]|nr:energy-coupling factor transporter ATPase [Candidatus Caballimonas caccae]
MEIIKAENLTFAYNERKDVIKNVSLSINSGEYIAIVGKNGSGKSTFAKLFNGLLIPKSGKITAFGFSSNKKEDLFEIRKRVGVVFQNPDNQLVASIVEDDIAFGPENLGVTREEIKERIDFALSSVNMAEFKKCSTERLSGGQKQRIAIAGVLALKPQVLILDESTSMLDPIGRKEVLNVVKKLNREQGTTVIAITHYMDEVVDSDRVIVLDEGEVVLDGTPNEIFSKKEVINKLGLELPFVTEIANKLTENGIEIDGEVLTEDGLVEALCKLK